MYEKKIVQEKSTLFKFNLKDLWRADFSEISGVSGKLRNIGQISHNFQTMFMLLRPSRNEKKTRKNAS